jgi:hypothetical protein
VSHLRDLDRADCPERITADGPHILPMGYALVDDAIAIRTSAYSILGSHADGAVVATPRPGSQE